MSKLARTQAQRRDPAGRYNRFSKTRQVSNSMSRYRSRSVKEWMLCRINLKESDGLGHYLRAIERDAPAGLRRPSECRSWTRWGKQDLVCCATDLGAGIVLPGRTSACALDHRTGAMCNPSVPTVRCGQQSRGLLERDPSSARPFRDRPRAGPTRAGRCRRRAPGAYRHRARKHGARAAATEGRTIRSDPGVPGLAGAVDRPRRACAFAASGPWRRGVLSPKRKNPVRVSGPGSGSVSLVAGTGFEPVTFRL